MDILMTLMAGVGMCALVEVCWPLSYCPRITPPTNQNPITTKTTPPANDEDEPTNVETREASPAHFLTKIESFSLLSDYGIQKYETREFVAGDYKWRLIIYPDGKENGNHVSVYLAMADTSFLPEDWEFSATFTIFLYNQILDKYRCFRVNELRFNKTKSVWGFPKFMSKKALIDQSNGYLVDDNFVLGAEVLVIKRHRVIESVTLLKPTENPQKCNWKIEEVSKLEHDDGVWVSEEFTMRDVDWKVKLYSTGNSNSKSRELSMELLCASADTFAAHQKVKAEFYMRLKGSPGVVRSSGKLSHWFTSTDKSCGQKKFISFVQLRNPKDGFLIDDCCTLQVEIFVQLVV